MGFHLIAVVSAERLSGAGAGAARDRGRNVKAERLRTLEGTILSDETCEFLNLETLVMSKMLLVLVQHLWDVAAYYIEYFTGRLCFRRRIQQF